MCITGRLAHFESVFLSTYFIPIRAGASRVDKEKRADRLLNKLYSNKYNINLYKSNILYYNLLHKGGNKMKQTNTTTNEEEKIVIFEADDVNDPHWDEIIHVLKLAGIETRFADGNWMNFVWAKRKL